jgi:ABC-2 type transport system ATP-binding protein
MQDHDAGHARTARGDAAAAPSAEALLEAGDVRKSYGRHEVLRGVDLAAGPGQLVAVVGENGAGKSTLLKILAGTLTADGGTVALAGTLGYRPQDPVLSDSLTVDQHLRYSRPPTSCPRCTGPASWPASELAGQLGYAQQRHEAAGTLSGGPGRS